MPYKDKTKAKEYAKDAMRRKRQGITSGVIPVIPSEPKGITKSPDNVIPDVIPDVIPSRFRPFSKEEQLEVKMSKGSAFKKQAKWEELQRG